MSEKGKAKSVVFEALRESRGDFEKFVQRAEAGDEAAALADGVADVLLDLNSGITDADAEIVNCLFELATLVSSEKLRTVAIGTLWREDLDWLSMRVGNEETARELLLKIVAEDKPKALTPVFWRAVSEKGPRFAAIAFRAAEHDHPHEAARLLVRLCRAAVAGRYDLEIRSAVDGFLAGQDSSVRTTFLNEVKRMPEAEKRKLMTHLDMSLMAELDRSAVEHRGKEFYYDEEAEKQKRDSKSKDIFDEVRRRLEKGEKPQF